MSLSPIATSSLEEGLDFACNLLAHGLGEAARRNPSEASAMLTRLTQYISLRYAGELRLACEYAESLAELIPEDVEFRRGQFEAQVAWLKKEMGPELS